MIIDPKYNFIVCQKYFFAIQSKVSIFHQIQPSYRYLAINCSCWDLSVDGGVCEDEDDGGQDQLQQQDEDTTEDCDVATAMTVAFP